MTSALELDRAKYMAFNEAMLRYTVGMAVRNNTKVGTGTLVSFRGRRYILTAEHVVSGVGLSEVRYFIPPSTPLMEHSMRNGLPQRFELAYAGDLFRVREGSIIDRGQDIAAIALADSSLMPQYMRFFPIEDCARTISDGCSLLVIGFPIDNSAALKGGDQYSSMQRAVGLTSEHVQFSSALQDKFLLHSSYDPVRHFLIDYFRVDDGITPGGFSGAAAWYPGPFGGSIWEAKPIFAGMLTNWHVKRRSHPHLLQGTKAAFLKKWFRQNG